jgi:hypothetical protein
MRQMRIIFLVTLFLFAFPVFSIDEEIPVFIPCEKTYISPEQVNISNDGIFVNINGGWVKTSCIQCDTEGLYFNDIQQEYAEWICSRCGAENNGFNKICKNCGAPRY